MGCCISHPDEANSPYPRGAAVSGSARAINDPPPQQVIISPARRSADGSLASPVSGHGHQRRRNRTVDTRDQTLGQHINKPLRRHEWISSSGTAWTPSSLEHERHEFFDTRVTGREEIWQAIRTALELMWEADIKARNSRIQHQSLHQDELEESELNATANLSEEDRQSALITAQTILFAAEITLPTGDLADGAYDTFGNYYQLPEHIVADPINIVLDGNQSGYNETKGELTAGEDTAEEDLDDDESAARRREEKGKAVVDLRDQVTLKARLSEGDRDINISIGRGESVRSVARRIAEEAMLPNIKKVRLAYMGKILKEGSSLLSQGWKQGHVVNAMVFSS